VEELLLPAIEYKWGLMMLGTGEIHTQVPLQSAFEVELVTEKPESHKSPGSDKIPAELIKAGD